MHIREFNSVLSHANGTATNASAVALAGNADRAYLLIQNQDAAAYVYTRTDGSAATANGACLRIDPGKAWEPKVVPTGNITLISNGTAVYHIVYA